MGAADGAAGIGVGAVRLQGPGIGELIRIKISTMYITMSVSYILWYCIKPFVRSTREQRREATIFFFRALFLRE